MCCLSDEEYCHHGDQHLSDRTMDTIPSGALFLEIVLVLGTTLPWGAAGGRQGADGEMCRGLLPLGSGATAPQDSTPPFTVFADGDIYTPGTTLTGRCMRRRDRG